MNGLVDYPKLLEMNAISKSFPGVQALDDVSIELRRGEVLALLGENGAGKSTLIKVLGGAYVPEGGEFFLEGKRVTPGNPTAAQAAGISVIYQEFNLIPELTVTENIFLGREVSRWGMINSRRERELSIGLLKKIGLDIALWHLIHRYYEGSAC